MKSRNASKGTLGREVTGEALDPFRELGRLLLGSDRALFEGYEHLLDEPDRFGWDELCVLYDRLAVAAEGRMTLEECGRRGIEAPKFGATLGVLATITSPRLLYVLGDRFGLSRTFSHLVVHHEVLPSGQIRIDVRIPETHQHSDVFFRITAGILEALPKLLALPAAKVVLTLEERHGIFLVRPPASRTIFARIIRAIRAAFASEHALEQLNAQQDAMNEQLQRLEAVHVQMHQALEVKRRFLSIMSHELRTPLNGIVGSMAGLREEADPRENLALRAALEDSTVNLTRLIEGVLSLAEGDTDDLPISLAELDLRTALGDVLDRMREVCERTSLEFECTFTDTVQQRLLCDATGVVMIVDRLLENAAKFTPSGKVSCHFDFEDGSIVASVRDTGIGIASRDHQRIFGLFTQLEDASTRTYGGAGLGLALVERRTKAVGGSVEVTSALGQGSTFTVRLPAVIVPKSQQAERRPAPRSSHVLVVDDNRVNRMVVSRMLKRLGLTVDEAENGRIAVELAAKRAYAAIFMDCEMPVMNGWDATTTIRDQLGDDVPIIAITAYVTDGDRARCEEAGMCDFLSKPVSPTQVQRTLERWTGWSAGPENGPAPMKPDTTVN